MNARYSPLVNTDNAGRPKVAIPVIERYVAWSAVQRDGRKTIMEVVSADDRAGWVKRRIEAVIDDMRKLERLSTSRNGSGIYGSNSIPNTHWMTRRTVVDSQDDFVNFIVDFDKCLVEGIAAYGAEREQRDYLGRVVRDSFPDLHDALKRVNVYRTNSVHIRLYPDAEESLDDFLNRDLEGRRAESVEELWFVLQQCVLDGLHASLQAEISRLDS